VLLIDLDGFRRFDDTLRHLVGGCTKVRAPATWLPVAPEVAVNVTVAQVSQPQLPGLLQILEQTALTADCLELELTEQAIVDVGSEATIALRGVVDPGVSLAIEISTAASPRSPTCVSCRCRRSRSAARSSAGSAAPGTNQALEAPGLNVLPAAGFSRRP
jgi:predicted signal transduction protein with EAL and GGDEF domain